MALLGIDDGMSEEADEYIYIIIEQNSDDGERGDDRCQLSSLSSLEIKVWELWSLNRIVLKIKLLYINSYHKVNPEKIGTFWGVYRQ